MRALSLLELAIKMIQAGEPLMIKGAPGNGKTDIVIRACEFLGVDLLIEHPVVADPTDPKGLPALVDGLAEFLPYGRMRLMMNAKRKTVVFLDDLGQAPPVVQVAYMQMILTREIGGKKISKHVTFIAATNRREDKAGVTSIPEPVKSRFATIIQLDAHVADWAAWAEKAGMPAELIAYCQFRPHWFSAPGEVTNDIVNRPSPRTIANLGRLYKLGIDSLEVMEGSVGKGFAAEFFGFVKVWRQLPSIDGILTNPLKAIVPTEPSACFATVAALVAKVDGKNSSAIMQYLARMKEEFCVFGIIDAERRCKTFSNTRAAIEWKSAHANLFLNSAA